MQESWCLQRRKCGLIDQLGPNGEVVCRVWDDVYQINFGTISRLEKVVSPLYSHMKYSPFKRAGICAFSCLFPVIFTDWETRFDELFVPEILTRHLPFKSPTNKVGGRTYAQDFIPFDETTLQSIQRDEVIANHNQVVGLESHERLERLQESDPFLDPIFTWISCEPLARALAEAREAQNAEWQAIAINPISLVIVESWYTLLARFGELGARACFVLG